MKSVQCCPLCGTREATPLLLITFARIFEELERQWSVVLSPEVAEAHAPTAEASLSKCVQCGLEYFQGAVSGDPRFYAELSEAFAYEEQRWEFDEVADQLSKTDRVVDLGAGTGVFLRIIRDKVTTAVGVDHNQPAIDRLRLAGLEGHAISFDEFAQERPLAFDVVTAFHLIEHITDVGYLVEPAIRLLRPGGRLVISAPNADRLASVEGLEPLDCPPHHVSRWRAEQWHRLAERFELQLAAVRYEPPPVIGYERLIAASLRRHGLGLLCRPVLALLWRTGATHRLYEKRISTGWFAERGLFGHSMLAEFVIP